MRLTEALSLVPEDGASRASLRELLDELREFAGERGLVHLEAALEEALQRLELGSFSEDSVRAVRILSGQYVTLAAMPGVSGAHAIPLADETALPVASLRGRRVLLADDEAEVRWFYVGVLREAGARVTEARDGLEALELARKEPPDLILADIVMPRLDGLGLCAAVRREPALDGVPLVLLSWRDDFLHRMKELRADAQDYLRKEVPASQIVERVSGVLGPLSRVEALLRSDGEAHGDLEELGVSGLLRAIRRLRPNASVVLQDPWSLFELELYEGRLLMATRTGIDGAISQGVDALPALVGMSSGRFVVAESGAEREPFDREPLDGLFREATQRLAALLGAMSEHPDCRVELDEDALGAYARHSPAGVQRMISRLVQGESPQALWESGAGSRSLVDALLVTLARQGAVREVTVPERSFEAATLSVSLEEADSRLNEPQIEQESAPVSDPLERENMRAQSAVAMHREPANRGPRRSNPVWRLNLGIDSPGLASSSGFGLELQLMSRILGLGFVALLTGTICLLLWGQLRLPRANISEPNLATAPSERAEPDPAAAPTGRPVEASRPAATGLAAFSGRLRDGVDPALAVAEGQGVLELLGASGLRVEVDGVGQRTLPVAIVLEQGRHAVRYRLGSQSTVRFYFVKSGATRSLEVVTLPGGFVDAR